MNIDLLKPTLSELEHKNKAIIPRVLGNKNAGDNNERPNEGHIPALPPVDSWLLAGFPQLTQSDNLTKRIQPEKRKPVMKFEEKLRTTPKRDYDDNDV